MTSFFDDLEAQLQRAAKARLDPGSAPPPRRRRGSGWLRGALRALPVVAAAGAVVVIAVGALLLLSHRHGHRAQPASQRDNRSFASIVASTPPPVLRRELAFIAAASDTVTRSTGCQVGPQLAGSVIRGTPGAGLLSTLGVLRRPQTRADRAQVKALQGTPEVYGSYVRQARVADGVTYFIAATRNDSRQWAPAVRCFGRELTALRRELPRIPAHLRHPTLLLEQRLIDYDRRLAADAPRDAVCLGVTSRNSGGSECGITAAEIRRGIPPTDDQGIYSGVVPDGVATVTLRFRVAHAGAVSVTAPVSDNLFVLRAPRSAGNGSSELNPVLTTWRSAQGQILKNIPAPTTGGRVAYCRQHPVACLVGTGGSSGSSASSSSSSASTTSTTAH